MGLVFEVWGLGVGCWGSGFRVQGSGLKFVQCFSVSAAAAPVKKFYGEHIYLVNFIGTVKLLLNDFLVPKKVL